MTDSKARIDPRYDPRFQRGYVGSETDAPTHAEAPTARVARGRARADRARAARAASSPTLPVSSPSRSR